jgi:hypothetical protein
MEGLNDISPCFCTTFPFFETPQKHIFQRERLLLPILMAIEACYNRHGIEWTSLSNSGLLCPMENRHFKLIVYADKRTQRVVVYFTYKIRDGLSPGNSLKWYSLFHHENLSFSPLYIRRLIPTLSTSFPTLADLSMRWCVRHINFRRGSRRLPSISELEILPLIKDRWSKLHDLMNYTHDTFFRDKLMYHTKNANMYPF